MATTGGNRMLGITVLSDFVLSEGIESILSNLKAAGATAIACNPTVTAEAEEGVGTFQPPADAGSSPRKFDRPLFGKDALWVESAPSYEPKAALYEGLAYGPRKTKPLTSTHGQQVREFIEAAQKEGFQVVFQLGAVQPSGLRDEDRPRQPDGTVAKMRMADTGCLASPDIRAYNAAYWRDLVEAYPMIDGLRIDWPEYPCYTMAEVFHDFSPHVEQWASGSEFDFAAIQAAVSQLFEHLHGHLKTEQLADTRGMRVDQALAHLMGGEDPLIYQWLAMKRQLSTECVAEWRQQIEQIGPDSCQLTAHAFMVPYSLVTGLDLASVASHSDQVSPKFYTMHWPLMVEFWSNWLMERNPSLPRDLVVGTIASWMELGSDDEIDAHLPDYHYPLPDEPHPIPISAQQAKLAEAANCLGDNAGKLVPLVHGYGPLDDFSKRFRTIAEADVHGVWINRYGYLSDDKLSAIGRCMSELNKQL